MAKDVAQDEEGLPSSHSPVESAQSPLVVQPDNEQSELQSHVAIVGFWSDESAGVESQTTEVEGATSSALPSTTQSDDRHRRSSAELASDALARFWCLKYRGLKEVHAATKRECRAQALQLERLQRETRFYQREWERVHDQHLVLELRANQVHLGHLTEKATLNFGTKHSPWM
ncbi:hypothetical protein BV25DRAFT_1988074 [Artomyces pyxidatus]|uniref:Uncharacterized protein n=1 Tax=Artomyces pyxidatus TaxID=48021 RepID=A0ACB8TF57_9AGAM|nr:hypothetical protein BV25DRAFT_1988074 [Artomyces pyxidatus]